MGSCVQMEWVIGCGGLSGYFKDLGYGYSITTDLSMGKKRQSKLLESCIIRDKAEPITNFRASFCAFSRATCDRSHQ